MALCTINRPSILFVTGLALFMKGIWSCWGILTVICMAFPARGGPVSFVFKVMMAVGAVNAIPRFGHMFFMVKQDIPSGIFQHDSYGLFGRLFCKGCVTDYTHHKEYCCKAISDHPLCFNFHYLVSSAL